MNWIYHIGWLHKYLKKSICHRCRPRPNTVAMQSPPFESALQTHITALQSPSQSLSRSHTTLPLNIHPSTLSSPAFLYPTLRTKSPNNNNTHTPPTTPHRSPPRPHHPFPYRPQHNTPAAALAGHNTSPVVAAADTRTPAVDTPAVDTLAADTVAVVGCSNRRRRAGRRSSPAGPGSRRRRVRRPGGREGGMRGGRRICWTWLFLVWVLVMERILVFLEVGRDEDREGGRTWDIVSSLCIAAAELSRVSTVVVAQLGRTPRAREIELERGSPGSPGFRRKDRRPDCGWESRQ